MMQSRTHNCNQLRIENVGEKVKLDGWMENVRVVSANLAFVVVRDFYGTTQVVAETEDMVNTFKAITKESTISVEGTVRERDSKTNKTAVIFLTNKQNVGLKPDSTSYYSPYSCCGEICELVWNIFGTEAPAETLADKIGAWL